MGVIHGIYLDLDDTLCAYWDASKLALRETFDAHGPPGFTVDDMIGAWAQAFRDFSPSLKHTGWYETYLKFGEPTRTEQMRRTLAEIGIEDSELARTLGDAYGAARDRNLKLFPESLEFLDRAKEKGYKLGLITNGPADIQRQEIATLGIERYFDAVLIEGEMGEGKPKPGVFRRAEREFGLSGSEILFVGNSYAHDIAPAIEAGWRTAWIRRPSDVPPSAPTGSGPRSFDDRPDGAPPPDLMTDNLLAVLDWLDRALF
ncbi:MAG: Phosphoglycolate phosphatase [Fimbriimonadaceae bacterium]|nr:Phosphoglycolate phosphatase [Fimbriimonadaceae bacterium]